MFQHDGKLQHLLPPQAYYSSDWFAQEAQALSQDSWGFVGSCKELPNHGDQLATEIWSTPILVRNEEGELKAFLNVCPHRHSCLSKPGKSSQLTLTCQYHGWQYGASGRLSHLPDGLSFKGLKTGEVALTALPVARLGDLLFVCINPDAEPLATGLGIFGEELEGAFGSHDEVARSMTEHDVNWKIIAENAVESYHVPMVHSGTFKTYRKSALHDHTLDQRYTRYADLKPLTDDIMGSVFQVANHVLLGPSKPQRFIQAHVFPTLLFYYHPMISNMVVLEPLGPKKTRQTVVTFLPRKIRLAFLLRPFQRLFAKLFIRFGRNVMKEDMCLWDSVQKGLEASSYSGVLSAREERVYSFQRYIEKIMTMAKPVENKEPSELEQVKKRTL